ncbi:MAG: hypothetical protein GTO76_01115 [Planctomycetales bacterium]|nr:hypothetical protein [Planctomycetales bacterium]NIP03460.1 hypothetical protein [Planctomycetales bacterium]
MDCANCRIKSACQLTGILREAQMAFYNVLKSYTLADAMAASPGLEDILAARSFSKVMAE